MKELPDDFFTTPEANQAMEDINNNLTRILDGPYKDALLFWHLKNSSPTFGLIVAGRTPDNLWKYYWHERNRLAIFGDREAEYPKIFQQYRSLCKRVEELNNPECPHRLDCLKGTVFEIMIWVQEDATPNPATEKYSEEMKRRLPGSVRE